MRNANPFNSPVLPGIARVRNFASLAVLAGALCGAGLLAAQTPATEAPSAPAHQPVHPRKHHAAPPEQSPLPPPAALPAPPPEPEAPLWPANEKPVDATVTWDSLGLRIDASNSSLEQILNDVAADTGAKVEGFDADERVFGAFGPGQARDVLSQLLQGSGYNVMLIGDQGQGTPREIVLSARHAGDEQPAANPAPTVDEDAEEQPAPPTYRPSSNFGPGGPHSPQQMVDARQQEMDQRQQQRQDMQNRQNRGGQFPQPDPQ
ncbi:MAG: hypothetical protein ABSD44_10790 [Terracidiphilus sp.]